MGKKKKKNRGKKGKNNGNKPKNKYNEESGYKGEENYDKENHGFRIQGKRYNRRQKRYQNKRNQNKSKYDRDVTMLVEKLRPLGLQIKSMMSDGNCMWRSLADQLCQDESRWKFYKKQVLTFMKVNRDHFAPFIFDQTFDEYMDEIKKDEEWAGDLELMAVTKTFSVNLIILQSDKPNLEFFDSPESQTIHFSYHLQEHYNSVRKTKNFEKTIIKSKQVGDSGDGKSEVRVDTAKKIENKVPAPVQENVSIISEDNMGFIIAATGCMKGNYIKRVYMEHNLDVAQTVEFLLMERNIYETRNVPEYRFWEDVDNSTDHMALQQQQNLLLNRLPPAPGGSRGNDNSNFTPINVQRKPKPKRLTKREKKELAKQKRQQEAQERKKGYLTKKQRKEKEKREEAERKRSEKVNKGRKYRDRYGDDVGRNNNHQDDNNDGNNDEGPLEPGQLETIRM